MDEAFASQSGSTAAERPSGLSVPNLTLPRGGGAIRGMGEKFAANPVTGSGSVTIPIAASPGRSGFGPQLSLSYDSGVGNGPFGFGWNLSLPAITRKTDRGLPRYRDALGSDVFILSGAEDLVPVLDQVGGSWNARSVQRGLYGNSYRVDAYRPRVEGLFARIERWSNDSNPGDVFWRSISKDNITTWYGRTAESRITDPSDPARIFSWLICSSHDDKGNVMVYGYKAEDAQGISASTLNERNRTALSRSTNRYLKHIRYGNRLPYFPDSSLPEAVPLPDEWLFELVLDYGEHDPDEPRPAVEIRPWDLRNDSFSSYRAGFDVRSYRLCQRVLMFHHFPEEADVGPDCLVRSTDLTYSYELDPSNADNPIFSFLLSAVQNGYRRAPAGGYVRRSLPAVEFEYSRPIISGEVSDLDPRSLENLPVGLDGGQYQWVDLDGEGLSGILSQQAGAYYYKPNLSPAAITSAAAVEFGPTRCLAQQPPLSGNASQQWLDLAGDGQLDLVYLDGPTPGFSERSDDSGWTGFKPFDSLPRIDWADANLRFVDLTGDGHADVLITEDDAFCWYASLAEAGFAPAERLQQALDEEQGPRLVFADGKQSIYLADMSGDGLTDLARVRNGEVCYWPNLGYGRFGAKVGMDNAPWLDRPDQFDQSRIRLADIDGSGVIDIIYLAADGVKLYFNQSGNSWGAERKLAAFPPLDNLAAVQVADLMGNGTACLVWSSPLAGDAASPMRYVDLMGGQKPHLLTRSVNNLGAETLAFYAPSTKFYLADAFAGKPWITKIPFPVHVLERVETCDRISGNRFVTRYAYHHGYFDGTEREFRGFGMVEQWDTEEYAALAESQTLSPGTNIDASSHVPPVLTRTWYHTGVYLGGGGISNYFAGLLDANDTGEYYREPDLDDAEAKALLLADTILPEGLTTEEEREACRALKGAMLRQEVYALDDSEKEAHPYAVTEQNFTLRMLQPKAGNPHAVFFSHPREAISYHYERKPADPRIGHALTLEVDDFGNALRSAAVGYGRRQADTTLTPTEQGEQSAIHVTCTESGFTNPVDNEDRYRTPLPSESRSFEVTGLRFAPGARFDFATLNTAITEAEELPYETPPDANREQKRLIEHVRTLYRPDDLGASHGGDPLALLTLGQLESLALPGESYKLAFTPGLLAQVYGERVSDAMLADEGRYVHNEGDANWWLHAGRIFFSPATDAAATAELAIARQHFFTQRRYRDPFHSPARSTETLVTFDTYNLMPVEVRDAIDNVVATRNDYRTLQPSQVTDPNGNRSMAAFDALGLIVGTAVMGKAPPATVEGDSLDGFEPDLDDATIAAHLADPLDYPHSILQRASTRLIYDLYAYQRTKAEPQPQAPVVYALVRETHDADLTDGALTKVQHAFSYSDGFGREIQKKIQAEPGPVTDGGPVVSPRWVGSGWTVFNNKGKPVRQYEPFFTDTHVFEFDVRRGVSPILFYDPVQRVVATLNPNHTWQKVVFDPWRQETWDVNDTVVIDDPKEPNDDPDVDNSDVADYFRRLPDADYLPSWYAQRADGALGAQEQAAATKAAVHAFTPSAAHVDSLGRAFLTVAHNRLKRSDTPVNDPPEEAFRRTRVVLDIEGNQRNVIDALDRSVMRYDYDMLGNQVHSWSMDAGERWLLNDIADKPIRAWDSRGFARRLTYDALRRSTGLFVTESGVERLAERTVYGEALGAATNHRGRVSQQFDAAGVVTSIGYDFKGNLLSSQRDLLPDYQSGVDWLQDPSATDGRFTSSGTYDALNRPVTATSPDGSVYRPQFNDANLLQQVDVHLRGAGTATHFVTNIDYDAKGQRQQISYYNGAVAAYEYDPLTFRLMRLKTTRPAGADTTASQIFESPTLVQDLRYVYDPVGNLTRIHDAALNTTFRDGQQIDPAAGYAYDAIYQLIEATGREHIGQSAFNFDPPGGACRDYPFVGNRANPNDLQALRNYTERYQYDAVGNFETMAHLASGAGWTRRYEYGEPSLIEAGKPSNRLSQTTVGNGFTQVERYAHDAHGNMTALPHLPLMRWDYRDQLMASARQVVNDGTPETTYYVYDAAGQRVRKVTERSANAGVTAARKNERIYLGGFEVYREYDGAGAAVTLERESLHVMDDQQRVALVETQTVEDGSVVRTPVPLQRYQFGNHLGSASVELDGGGALIGYEEYHPYGTSAFQAGRSAAEVSLKRYRYTGMERDEETGLACHGVRYYATWLGRWASADPKGVNTGINRYRYGSGNPANRLDPSGLEDVASQSWTDWFLSFNPFSNIPLMDATRTLGPVYGDPVHLDPDAVKEGQTRTAESVSDVGSTILDIVLSVAGSGIELPIGRGWGAAERGPSMSRAPVAEGVARTVVASEARKGVEAASLSRVDPLAKKLTDTFYKNLERAAARAGNEVISTGAVRGIEGVPVIMAQGESAEAAAQLRHFSEGQGFSFAMDPRNREWVAIATGEGAAPTAQLRSGRVMPAAQRNGTHLDGASLLARRPLTLEESRAAGLFGGAIVMRADNTIELGVASGVLNRAYVNGPGGAMGRTLPEAEIQMMTELFESMGFQTIVNR
ncbi:MAG: SpvB/TcaC N-terminal domain-containing protein [Candidatus Dechloromonas phosphoritropha]